MINTITVAHFVIVELDLTRRGPVGVISGILILWLFGNVTRFYLVKK